MPLCFDLETAARGLAAAVLDTWGAEGSAFLPLSQLQHFG